MLGTGREGTEASREFQFRPLVLIEAIEEVGGRRELRRSDERRLEKGADQGPRRESD